MAVPIDGYCDTRFSRVREIFTRRMEDGCEVGAAIAFTLNGDPVVDLWGGYYADTPEQNGREWQRETLVNVYSTTKGMTALCAHRLVEQGRLDLDARVAEYWPEFAQAGKAEVPVRWLLSHQVGLPAIRPDMPKGSFYDWQAMCEGIAESEPWWPPGSKHGYHPVTFGHLVGEVIRRIDGLSVGQLFREDIAEPLEADFHIGLAEEHDARVSRMIGGLVPRRSKAAQGQEAGVDETEAVQDSGPMGDFMRDMTDPKTMVERAFNNPWLEAGAVNTRDWRAAEIPAANGHGTARSPAAARSTGCASSKGSRSIALAPSRPRAPTRPSARCPCATDRASCFAAISRPSRPTRTLSAIPAQAARSAWPIPTPGSASASR